MPLLLTNTLTRRLEPFAPGDGSRVTFYSCGPTVYDDAHIGNFRSFLAADVLRRFLESPLCVLSDGRPGPRKVVHVMNITDVGHMTDDAGEEGEDKMALAGRRLLEAKKAGTLPAGVSIDPGDPAAIARFYEARFREDAKRLGLKVALEADASPQLMPRASAHVAGMQAVVARLLERGFAYVVGQTPARAVYFDVQKFAPYGRLSGNSLEKLRAGAGGRVSGENQAQKKHPADFLLWKEDPRHAMRWPSPWGEGYPGWHIECTAMSAEIARGLNAAGLAAFRLPEGESLLDLHSGGEDNIFPHHECEIAQGCAAFGADPARASIARHWFHPRFLLVNGEKMSKSKGNFFTARDLFAPPPQGRGVEPAAVRFELIRTHYRSNADFTTQGLTDAQRTIDRWRRFMSAAAAGGKGDAAAAARCREEFARAMHDDLNTAGAIAALNTLVNDVSSPGKPEAALLSELDSVLGILEREAPAQTSSEIGLFVGVAPSAEVNEKLEERKKARAAKDFARSDAIRDELRAMGYAIKDVAGGRVEVRAT